MLLCLHVLLTSWAPFPSLSFPSGGLLGHAPAWMSMSFPLSCWTQMFSSEKSVPKHRAALSANSSFPWGWGRQEACLNPPIGGIHLLAALQCSTRTIASTGIVQSKPEDSEFITLQPRHCCPHGTYLPSSVVSSPWNNIPPSQSPPETQKRAEKSSSPAAAGESGEKSLWREG